MSYIELHCASAFSFLEAASLPETLIDRAAELGYPALALLDRDGVFGAPRFHKAATAAGIRPIVGAELTISSGQGDTSATGSGRRPRASPLWTPCDAGLTSPEAVGVPDGPVPPSPTADRRPTPHGSMPFRVSPSIARSATSPPRLPQRDPRDPLSTTHYPLSTDVWRLPVLVESQEGYRNLCRLVTRMKLRAPKGEGALALEELEGRTAGLVALAGREALVGRRYGVGGLRRSPGRAVRPRRTSTSSCSAICCATRRPTTQALVDLAAAFHVPVVATNGVRFARPDERPLFDVLTCIRHRTDLAPRRAAAGAERRAVPEAADGDGRALLAICRTPSPHAASWPIACEYTMADLGYRFPGLPGAARRDDELVPAEDHGGRRARAVPAVSRAGARADRARARSHREARSGRLLPHRLGHRQFLPAAATFSRRGAGRRPTAPSATASASRRWIRSGWICCSSGSCRRSAASGPTSISICRAAIGASGSSSTSTRSTGSTARR